MSTQNSLIGDTSLKKVPVSFILIILVLAFVSRAAYIIVSSPDLGFDEPVFDNLVQNIVSGKGYTYDSSAFNTSIPFQQTSWQEPAYPLVLAAFYSVAGPDHLAARIAQAVLSTATVFLIIIIAVRIFRTPAAGIIAGAFAAFDPATIYFSRLLMSETLFLFFLAAAILLWLSAIRTNTLLLWFMAGVAWGLCCLTRGLTMYFIPVVLILSFVVTRQRRSIQTLFILTGFVLCLMPWTFRNYVIHRAFIPITTKGGWNLYFYTYPSENTDFNGERYDIVPVPDLENFNELERSQLFQSRAVENIVRNPGLMLRFAVIKLIDFWDARLEQGPVILNFVNVVAFYAIVVFAAAATVTALLRKEWNAGLCLLWLIILFHSGMAMLFTGGGKARMPIQPSLLIMAGGGAFLALNHLFNQSSLLKPLVNRFKVEET